MLILIALLAAPQLWAALKDRKVLDSEYYRASPAIRLQYTAQYLMLAIMLAVMAYQVHEKLGPAVK
jgi:hypothetical protein